MNVWQEIDGRKINRIEIADSRAEKAVKEIENSG
jgi:hypothetical protein